MTKDKTPEDKKPKNPKSDKDKFTQSREKMPLQFYVDRIRTLTVGLASCDQASVDLLYKRADMDGITRGELDRALKRAELLEETPNE